ncbi:membrane protein [soil metagenome]
MRPVILCSALALAALSACSKTEKAPAVPSAPAASTPTSLGGVDLTKPVRAIGTEPFWSVDITSDAVTYVGLDNQPRRAANPQPVIQGTTATYTTEDDDGTAMIVTLIATECSDGMSDRTYPLTARIQLGEVKLNGCAASQAALANPAA